MKERGTYSKYKNGPVGSQLMKRARHRPQLGLSNVKTGAYTKSNSCLELWLRRQRQGKETRMWSWKYKSGVTSEISSVDLYHRPPYRIKKKHLSKTFC